MTEEQFIKAEKLRRQIDDKKDELKRILSLEGKELSVWGDGNRAHVPAIFNRVFITLLKDNCERNLANIQSEYEKI